MFFGPSALQLRSKVDKKASPDRVKIKEKSCQHLDANFDRFGSQLGSILGGFWRPSWTQVGTKWQQTRPHNQSKIWSLLRRPPERILKGFWFQLGSNLDHLGLKSLPGLVKNEVQIQKKRSKDIAKTYQKMQYAITTKDNGEYLPLLVFPKETCWPQTLAFEPPVEAKIPQITKVRQDQPAPPKIW